MDNSKVIARGERAATSGYNEQYCYFASQVYNALVEGNFVKLHAADNKNGILDDTYFELSNEIHACQLKHSISNNATISFADFSKLLPDICNSWKRIKDAHHKKHVIAHFITTKTASIKDIISDKKEEKIGNFNDFLQEVVPALKNNTQPDNKWTHVVNKLRNCATDISDEDYASFWNNFDIQIAYPKSKLTISDNSQKTRDILEICRLIIELVSDENRQVVCDKEELIRRLGWENKFRTKFNHNLFPDNFYVPIQQTIKNLEDSINELESGYVFLLGAPGSGKSSLLSFWSNNTTHETNSYFAFDFINPSSQSNYYIRGEANTLYHDLIVSFKEKGYTGDNNELMKDDLIYLKKCFSNIINKLSDNYEKDNIKRIIIIDGLDHVSREYRSTEHSFLTELPLPNELPSGVIIILGSQLQQLNDLPHELKEKEKKGIKIIDIASLSREESNRLIKNKLGANTLNEEQLRRIYNITQGHPLYTQYVINTIRHEDNIDHKINEMPAYQDNIESYYKHIFENKFNKKQNDILGKIARIYGNIDKSFLWEWNIDFNELHNVLATAKTFLKYDKYFKHYTFFHNSFKIYIQDITAQDADGEYYQKQDIKYHSELADLYINSTTEHKWKSLPHLYISNRTEEFISLATPDYLHEQLINFVQLETIKEITKQALQIVQRKHNANLILRYTLLLCELNKLSNKPFSTEDLYKDLYSIGEKEKSLQLLLNNPTYIENNFKEITNWIIKLYNDNLHEIAFKIFSLLSPILNNKETAPPFLGNTYTTKNVSRIERWMQSASCFYNINEIRNRYQDFHKKSMCSYSYEKFESLLELNFCIGLIECKKHNEILELIQKNILSLNNEDYITLLHYILNQDIPTNTFNKLSIVKLLENKYDSLHLSAYDKFAIAYQKDKINNPKEEIEQLLTNLDISLFSDIHSPSYELDDTPFILLFHLSRLRTKYGFSDDWNDLCNSIPTKPHNNKSEHAILVSTYICKLGEIAANSLNTSSYNLLLLHLKELLTPSNTDDYNIYQINNITRDVYIKQAIITASKASHVYLKKLAKDLFTFMLDESYLWSLSSRIETLDTLLNLEVPETEIRNTFNKLIEQSRALTNSEDRISFYRSISLFWHKLNNNSKALHYLKLSVKENLSLSYRKDFELETFINWTIIANQETPDKAIERLHWFTRRLKIIESAIELPYTFSPAFLFAGFDHSLSTGLKLGKWLIKNEHISFQTLSAVLVEALLSRISCESDFFNLINYYFNIHLDTICNRESYNESRVLKKIIKIAKQILNEQNYLDFTKKLKNEILTRTNSDIRNNLLKTIDTSNQTNTNVDTTNDNDIIKTQLEEARKCLSNNNFDRAKELLSQVIESAHPSDWYRLYAGGTKIDAYKMLIHIEQKEASYQAMDDFVYNFTKQGSEAFILNMDEIMPLFDPNYNRVLAYDEFKHHMERLTRDYFDEKPDLSDDGDNLFSTLCKHLIYISKLPIPYLTDTCSYTLAQIAISNPNSAVDLILNEPDYDFSIIHILGYINELAPSLLPYFYTKLEHLSKSPYFQLNRYAKELLNKHESKSDIFKPLPICYNITLPNESETSYYKYYISSSMDSKEHHIYDKSKPFFHIVYFISAITNLPWARLMRILVSYTISINSSIEDYSKNDENRKRLLNNIGLRYYYTFTATSDFYNALNKMINELINSNIIEINLIEDIIPPFDYSPLTWNNNIKPPFISLFDPHQYNFNNSWVREVETSDRLLCPLKTYKNFNVIAESSSIYRMSSRASEIFKSQIIPARSDSPKAFWITSQISTPYCHYRKSSYSIHQIIQQKRLHYAQHDVKSQYLALNPEIANSLGWVSSSDGIAAWDDTQGNRMMESIYWRYGNTHSFSNSSSSGEGWMVLASNEALEQLQQLISPLIQLKEIKRSANNSSFTKKSYESFDGFPVDINPLWES